MFINKDEEIKNRFLIGIQDKGLSELLLLTSDLILLSTWVVEYASGTSAEE